MVRGVIGALLTVLVLTGPGWGQSGPRWHWQKGQVLVYRFEQNTQAADVISNARVETSTRLQLTKRWEILDLDGQGVATLQLKLQALKMETTTPSGEVLVFDSTNPEKSTEGLRERLAAFVGPVLAVLRVDARGQVVEVKQSNFGPASKYQNELPFAGVLPASLSQQDQSWDHDYQITLDPPQGTGEQFAAVRHFRLKSADATTMTVALTTELKQKPSLPADQVPLLQLIPEGEWVFDHKNGRLIRAQFQIDRTLENHRGEGSSHHFRSQTAEQLIE